MRIERLLIENFRSIERLELTDIPDVAVFYGPNGSGKSNVLDAIAVMWSLVPDCIAAGPSVGVGTTRVGRTDIPFGSSLPAIRFECTLALGGRAFRADGWRTHRVTFAVSVSVSSKGEGQATLRGLQAETISKHGPQVLVADDQEPTWSTLSVLDKRAARIVFETWCRGFLHALPLGVMAVPELRGVNRGEGPTGLSIPDLAIQGYFEAAAFKALVSPDAEMLARLERLKHLLTSPPLNRPPFRPVELGPGQYGLQEVVQKGNTAVGIPLERAGLGVQQLYPILGSIVLSGAPIVTIEEPEAHLHARTTGRMLRDILRGLVPGTVNQLFVATHSELFDLNPREYYDVSLDDGGHTVVTRCTDLVDIDDRHTYSPGAARHALMDALARGEPDRFVFERPDGTGVRASEMVQLLVEDSPEAFAFLDTVTRSAVRAVTVKAHKRLTEG